MDNSLTGRLLVAMPGIGDPRFERAVIYVCTHTHDDAMGLAVNRPIDGIDLSQMLDKLGIDGAAEAEPGEVMFGGPVERERGFVLHTDDYISPEGSLPVGEGVALTATRDVLDAVVVRSRRPRKAIFALGYAGWSAGQLEEEIKNSVWLVCDADEQLIFGDDHEHKWGAALQRLGINAADLSVQAGRA